MNPILLTLYLRITGAVRDRAVRDEAGMSVILEMLLAALLLVVVYGAATPAIRDGVTNVIGDIFDKVTSGA